MEKPKSKYYPIVDLADEWNWNIEDILHYGGTGELQISYIDLSNSDPGPYPLSRKGVLQIIADKYEMPWRFEVNWDPEEECSNLVITDEERVRFEATCDMASNASPDTDEKERVGEKERISWLKIIYLLMHLLASKISCLTKGEGNNLNISEFEKKLKEVAPKYDLTEVGLSNSTLGTIYKEAENKLMPDSSKK